MNTKTYRLDTTINSTLKTLTGHKFYERTGLLVKIKINPTIETIHKIKVSDYFRELHPDLLHYQCRRNKTYIELILDNTLVLPKTFNVPTQFGGILLDLEHVKNPSIIYNNRYPMYYCIKDNKDRLYNAVSNYIKQNNRIPQIYDNDINVRVVQDIEVMLNKFNGFNSKDCVTKGDIINTAKLPKRIKSIMLNSLVEVNTNPIIQYILDEIDFMCTKYGNYKTQQ